MVKGCNCQCLSYLTHNWWFQYCYHCHRFFLYCRHRRRRWSFQKEESELLTCRAFCLCSPVYSYGFWKVLIDRLCERCRFLCYDQLSSSQFMLPHVPPLLSFTLVSSASELSLLPSLPDPQPLPVRTMSSNKVSQYILRCAMILSLTAVPFIKAGQLLVPIIFWQHGQSLCVWTAHYCLVGWR